MSFDLSQDQINELRTLQGENSPTKYADCYDYIVGLITYAGEPVDGVGADIWEWFQGAAKVNRGDGAFSDLIRAYTESEYSIRYGTNLSQQQLQDASNQIADKVITDIINTGSIPTLDFLGLNDASTVATNFFNSDAAGWSGNFLFSALGDNTFLNANLLSTPGDPYNILAALDSFAVGSGSISWYNYPQVISQFVNLLAGPTAPVASGAITDAASSILTFFVNTYGSSYNLYSWSNIILDKKGQSGPISGTDSADIIDAYDGDDTIIASANGDLIDGGSGNNTVDYTNAGSVTFNLTSSASDAVYIGSVDKAGILNSDLLYNIQTIKGSSQDDEFDLNGLDSRIRNLSLDGGDGSDTLTVAYSASANGSRTTTDQGTINFGSGGTVAFQNIETVDLIGDVPDLLNLTDLTTANVKVLFNLGASGSVAGPGGTQLVDTIDVSQFSSGATISMTASNNETVSENGLTLQVKGAEAVVGSSFDDTITLGVTSDGTGTEYANGGAGDDVITGGSGNDIIYGGTGADTLKGGAGDDILYSNDDKGSDDGAVDHLNGGPGADQLFVGNGDIVDAVDAGDRITFGALLTGGKRKVAADAPQSESGTYNGANGTTYIYDADAHTLTVQNGSGAITINGYTNGEAHIVLSTSRDKNPNPTPGTPAPTPPMGLPKNPPNPRDPLVLDLTGAGILLSGLDSSTAYFDYTNSGFRQHTGWITQGQGLLVTMPTDGQTITSNELLGAQSGSGFTDLAALDSNQDGVIDDSDPAYQTLGVWIDSDLDGASNAGELYSLSSLGITSISVASAPANTYEDGNTIVASGSFTVSGVQHQIDEANFATDRQVTIVPSNSSVPITAAAAILPNLVGYGSLPSLQVAMSQDSTLLGEVQDLVANSATLAGADFDAAFEQVVQRWAGASDVDPSSEGSYVDARHLAVDYAFYGIDPAADSTYQLLPNWHSGPLWETLYGDIVAELKVRFVSQIADSLDAGGASDADQTDNPYRALSFLAFDPSSDRFTGDISSAFKFAKALEPQDSGAAATYWGQVEPVLAALRIDVSDPTSLLVDAANAHFTAEQIGLLANDLGIAVDTTNGVISVPGGLDSVFFLDSSQSTAINANYKMVYLPDYDPSTTAVYRVAGSDDLTIENLDTSAILTLTGYFNSATIFPANINLVDGSTYSLTTVGRLIANGAMADVAAASSLQDKETVLGQLQYTVVTEPNSGPVSGGTIAYEISGNTALTINCDGGGIGGDIVYFANGALPQDIVVSQSGTNARDLILTNVSTGQTITLAGQGDNQNAHIQGVVFENGTTWTAQQIWAASEATAMATNAPVITSGYDQNSLTAGSGTVELVSNIGDSTFTTGDGADTISMSGFGNTYIVSPTTTALTIMRNSTFYGLQTPNVLDMPSDVDPSDVTVSQGGNDDIVVSTSSGLTVTLSSALFDFNYRNNNVGLIKFSDGTSWTIAQIAQMSIDTMLAQGNDTVILVNTGTEASFTAGPGDVTLDGWFLNYGGNPDATVMLTAGPGNDTLIAMPQGSTTFVIPGDAGNVELQKDQDYGAASTIEFGPGVSPDQIAVFQGTNGTYIFENVATGSEIKLYGSIVGDGGSWNKISKVTFADGTVWSGNDILDQIQTIYGGAGDDVLQAPDGNVTVYGQGGDDTLMAGAGSDILVGGGGITNFVVGNEPESVDILESQPSGWFPTMTVGQLSLTDIASSDVSAALDQNGTDVDLIVAGTNQRIRLAGEISDAPVVNGIAFSDGVTWALADIEQRVGVTPDPSKIEGTIGDDVLQAGPGDVTVIGEGGNDTLIAGDGNDTLIGGGGYTTYVVPASSSNVTIEAQSDGGNGGGGPGPIGIFAVNKASFNDSASGSSSSQLGPDGELDLHGVASSSIQASVAPDGNDVILSVVGSTETITLDNEMTSTPVVDGVIFDDGTTLSAQDIVNLTVPPQPLTILSGSEYPGTELPTTVTAEDSGTTDLNDVIDFGDSNLSATHSITLLGANASGNLSNDITNGSLSQALTFSGLTEPDNNNDPGTVNWAFDAPTSAFDYLQKGQYVDITYSYEIDSSQGASASQTIDVFVQRAYDSPVLTSSPSYTTDDETSITLSPSDLTASVTVTDPGDDLYLWNVYNAVGGTIGFDQNYNWVFTPDPTFTGTASFSYSIGDDTSNEVDGVATVQVAPHSILGTSGDDQLTGDASPATIDGGGGNDTLTAGSGGDTIIAGPGNDTLIGGYGTDKFTFNETAGNAIVEGFVASGSQHDTLHFSTSVFSDWSHLLQATRQSGSDLLIQTPNGSVITLQNTNISAFSASDARFG